MGVLDLKLGVVALGVPGTLLAGDGTELLAWLLLVPELAPRLMMLALPATLSVAGSKICGNLF
jgi:hypothetical protein